MMQRGFTLIELLVTVVIIAILAAIALPSYESYMRKSRRVDAKEALAALQFAQEKWRGNHDSYTDTLDDLGVSTTSSSGYYTVALTSGKSSATEYEATATAISPGPQANDSCTVLTVTQAGFFGDTTCWGLK